MRRTQGCRTLVGGVILALLLTGCRAGEPIGGEAWLDYSGPDRDVVLACVRALPPTIDAPDGYPGATEFTAITIYEEPVNDALSHFVVTGMLDLFYSAETGATYSWECQASRRYTIVKVNDLFHELVSSS